MKTLKDNNQGEMIIVIVVALVLISILGTGAFILTRKSDKTASKTSGPDTSSSVDETYKTKLLLARTASEVEGYASNNLGKYPTADANASTGFLGKFKSMYLDGVDSLKDFNFTAGDNTTTPTKANEIRYHSGASGYMCSGSTVTKSSNPRRIALTTYDASSKTVLCLDNE